MIKPIQRLIGLCFISLILLGHVEAQKDSVRLTKNFQFKDGLYLDFNAFQQDTPDFLWDSLRVSLVANPTTFLTQVEYIYETIGDSTQAIDPEKIWGFSLGGIPYIRLPKGAVKKELTTFAGIQLRGKICYFSYEDEETIKLKMPVYNPLNGRPFRVADVMRRRPVKHERILHYETGEVETFERSVFQKWIADDAQLLRTVEDLSEGEIQEKLFKCLLIYVDRNTVFIE